MPTVIVIDPSHVTIDGEPSGSVLDVPVNHAGVEGIKSLVLDALIAWDSARTQANVTALQASKDAHADDMKSLHDQCNAAQAASLATQAAAHAEAITKLQNSQSKQIAEFNGKLADQAKTIADLQSKVDALGGTELGQQMQKAAQIKAAHDAIAKAQAELANLGGVS